MAEINRTNEISAITRSIKILAKELDVCVILLSQLSRASEQRKDHRPMLSDLRESGSIEQDADIVVFLKRDDYYQNEDEEADTSSGNTCEVIIANTGAVLREPLTWHGLQGTRSSETSSTQYRFV